MGQFLVEGFLYFFFVFRYFEEGMFGILFISKSFTIWRWFCYFLHCELWLTADLFYLIMLSIFTTYQSQLVHIFYFASVLEHGIFFTIVVFLIKENNVTQKKATTIDSGFMDYLLFMYVVVHLLYHLLKYFFQFLDLLFVCVCLYVEIQLNED